MLALRSEEEETAALKEKNISAMNGMRSFASTAVVGSLLSECFDLFL